MIKLHVFQLLATVPVDDRSCKSRKNAFLNDGKCLAIFLSLACWIELVLHIVLRLLNILNIGLIPYCFKIGLNPYCLPSVFSLEFILVDCLPSVFSFEFILVEWAKPTLLTLCVLFGEHTG